MSMNPALLSVFGLSALTMMPIAMPDPPQDAYAANNCGTKITALEDQVQKAVDSSKVVHFIESNTTSFKSLEKTYTLYWLNTTYAWKSDISTCSAKLDGITASFQLSNATVPYLGVAHISVDPRMSNVTSVQVDIPNHAVSHR